MFQYFPTNYVWNLAVNIAMSGGGKIGEIDRVCRPLIEASMSGDDARTVDFFNSWCTVADSLVARAEEDLESGRRLSAGGKYARASMYYLVAERMQGPDFEPRKVAYRQMLDSFEKAVHHGRENVELVEIPYEGASYPALFYPAGTVDAPARTMVFCNGLDSMKEMLFRTGMAHELARRGIATLIVDQPGTGGALRLRGLHGTNESERWATAAFDYLLARPDVDKARIGMMGVSLGGYYAPRAVAFESRFALCAVWGANYDWGEMQRRRLAREGENPVPHYWNHVQWVFGKSSLDEFLEFAPSMTLEGIQDRIRVPYLVTHGADDKQIPLEYAHRQYETAVNSPHRELKIFTTEEGGSSHAGADNEAIGTAFISDWVNEHL